MTRRASGATLLVVLGLSAGVAAAGAEFVGAYLWRPLPYPLADRLVAVDFPREDGPGVRALETVDWSGVRAFADLTLSSDVDAFTVLGADAPFAVDGRWVTADVFAMFGAVPAAGRFFTADEAVRGQRLAVIGYRTWQERFGGRADAIGRTITARATIRQGTPVSYTIVGVLPRAFWHLEDRSELLLSMSADRPPTMLRLLAGVTPAEAALRLTALVGARISALPASWRVSVRPARDAHVADIRRVLLAAQSAVGLLVVAAFASLAFLQMARGIARQREVAVRKAVGASDAQLLLQAARDGLRTGAAAAALGLATAATLLWSGAAVVEQQVGRVLPGGLAALGRDPAVAVIGAVSTMAAALLLSLIGLASARVVALPSALAGRNAFTDTRTRVVARHVISMAQVAAAFCLLLMAGLMIRSAWHLARLDLGFNPGGVLTTNIALHESTYASLDERRAVFARIVDQVRAMPDVRAAGLTSWLPFRIGPSLWVEPQTAPDLEPLRATMRAVSPGYLEALQIGVVEGRTIGHEDVAGRRRVALVSRSLASAAWPDRSALGQQLRIRFTMADRTRPGFGPFTVIGVVADTRQSLIEPTPPQLYTSFAQEPLAGNAFLHVRTTRPPEDLVPALSRVLRQVDPTLPVDSAATLETVIARAGSRPEFLARALALLAVVGVAVAMAGLYAVSAWVARQRSREAAVRVALGGTPLAVGARMVSAGSAAIGAGLALGWAAATPLAALLAADLHGVAADDVPVRLLVAATLAAVSLVALWRPALRAVTANPVVLLRD